MNVYEKLQQVKLDLSKAALKKSGENKHSKYDYFELGDFLPKIIELCNNHKLATVISFTSEKGLLEIIDTEKITDKIIIETPMSTAKLPACHEVQNLGAVQTYLRRYLYVAAFDIVENDIVESSARKDELKKAAPQPLQGTNDSDLPADDFLVTLPSGAQKTITEMKRFELLAVTKDKNLAHLHDRVKELLGEVG